MNKQLSKTRVFVLVALLVAGASLFVLQTGAPTAAAAPQLALVFQDVWARAASEGHMSAVYMNVSNVGAADAVVVAARSDVADRVELHETTMELTVEDGKVSQVMHMGEIEQLEVAAGAAVELAPGGLHIMLIGLFRDIESGDHFELELELRSGERIVLQVPVKVGTADDDHDHHDHHDH